MRNKLLSPWAALQLANNEIGELYRRGSGLTGWGYNVWSEEHRAWRMPICGTSYATAQRDRRAAVIRRAVEWLLRSNHGLSSHDAEQECAYIDTHEFVAYQCKSDYYGRDRVGLIRELYSEIVARGVGA